MNLIAHATAATRTVIAVILGTPIRRDAEGRYCLNDLHRAAGELERHKPSNFMQLTSTVELVEEVSKGWDSSNKNPVEMSRGRYGGTYAVEDLALSYAMWISPRFHLDVLRGFKENRVKDTPAPAAPVATLSTLELLQLGMESEKQRLLLAAKIETDRPKVELAEATMADGTTMCLREAGQRFGMTDQQLTKMLIDAKVLYRDGKNSVFAYAKYLRAGCFIQKTLVSQGRALGRTHVTGKGTELIYRVRRRLQEAALAA